MIVEFEGSFVILNETVIYDTISYSDVEGLNEKVGTNESAWIVIDDGDVSSTIRITNNGLHFTMDEPLDRTLSVGTCIYSSDSAQRLEDEYDEEICVYPLVETEIYKFKVCEDGVEKFLTIDQLKETLGLQDILDRLSAIEDRLDSCEGECQETEDLLAGDMLTIRRNNTECKLIDACVAIARCQQSD